MDRYTSFADLSAHEREGIDYRIVEFRRASPVVVLAPHGGTIEPTTSEVAAAIACGDHSLYCFEGLRADRPHDDLHITSDRFDEPRARRLVANAQLAVAVHGRLNRDAPHSTWLGGLDELLIDLTAAELANAGFETAVNVTGCPARAQPTSATPRWAVEDYSWNCRAICATRCGAMPGSGTASPPRSVLPWPGGSAPTSRYPQARLMCDREAGKTSSAVPRGRVDGHKPSAYSHIAKFHNISYAN